jgi:pyridoxine/pyridoxamine 5'-phosphate oxidase
MTQTEEIYQFIQQRKLAVVATASSSLEPEAALVGIAVSDKLEIIFDTLDSTRKYKNLLANPRIAIVIGWESETTVQYEGEVVFLTAGELSAYKEIYFKAWPDGPGRQGWPGIAYVVARPKWIRYSSFETADNRAFELRFQPGG